MAGKRASAAGNRGGKAQAPGEQPSSNAKLKGKSKSKANAWPAWLWIVGGLALVMSLGRIFAGGDGAGTPSKSSSKSKASKASKSSSSGQASAARFLEIALRLQEMTDLSSRLVSSGSLDSEAAAQLSKELDGLEAEIGNDGTIARDLKSMVTVVRGTLIQTGNKLTDEEVEATGTAYTYANPRYWDDYYNKTTSDEKYDWYGTWDTPIIPTTFKPKGSGQQQAAVVGDFLRPYFSKESEILMFGCGNSDMSEKMYADGFESIMNIDISEQLLENLRSRLAASAPKMRWKYENASALSFGDAEFDVTIDKGTLDAIEGNKPLLRAAASEAHRTLRPGGYFLSVTFNSAPLRVDGQLMNAADWKECHSHEFERPAKRRDEEKSVYYVHACQKRN